MLTAIERFLARWARPSAPTPPDPFEGLVVLSRLDRVSQELTSLSDAHHWAPRARFNALTCAYDGLLLDACVLAGVSVPEHSSSVVTHPLTPLVRSRVEVALLERGWIW